jgi:hypothetical protein
VLERPLSRKADIQLIVLIVFCGIQVAIVSHNSLVNVLDVTLFHAFLYVMNVGIERQ